MLRYLTLLAVCCVAAFIGFRIGINTTPEVNIPPFVISESSQQAVDTQLKLLLKTIPDVQSVRLGLIHGGGPVRRSTVDRLRFDVLGAEANPGYNAGAKGQNLPLSQWDDYLPILIADRCPLIRVADMQEDAPRARILAYGAKAFMGCPIRAPNGNLEGAIFALWGGIPSGEIQSVAEEKLRIAARRIQQELTVK
jgi:hypothetical protein